MGVVPDLQDEQMHLARLPAIERGSLQGVPEHGGITRQCDGLVGDVDGDEMRAAREQIGNELGLGVELAIGMAIAQCIRNERVQRRFVGRKHECTQRISSRCNGSRGSSSAIDLVART
ncbi:hypothetical protein D3C71_1653330 [compost metagenome]